MHLRIAVSADELADFCRRWEVAELAFFGSVLRDDFGGDSDVDVLVTFHQHASWGMFDLVEMEIELGSLLGRRVDLLERRILEASENRIRRKAILDSAETVYAA